MSNIVSEYKYGKIIYNTNDIYIGKCISNYHQYCDEEVDVFRHFIKPGDNVIDVGANIGAHTIPMSQLVGASGKVYAFEPQRHLYHTLCGNMAINNITNVDCINKGVGINDRDMVVPELDYSKVNNFGGISLGNNPYTGDVNPENIVEVQRLDQTLAMCDISFMKIDVEGMELDVLKGADGVINNDRPIMYIENDIPDKSQALLEHLKSKDYELYWHTSNLVPEGSKNIFGVNYTCVNILCLPCKHDITGLKLEKIEDTSKWINNITYNE